MERVEAKNGFKEQTANVVMTGGLLFGLLGLLFGEAGLVAFGAEAILGGYLLKKA